MSIEETIRLVVREEVRSAMRELLAEARAAPAGNPDEKLTKAEAAALAGASLSTVQRWISSGELPVEKKNRHIRVRRGDLEALLTRSHQIVKGSEADADELADRLIRESRQ